MAKVFKRAASTDKTGQGKKWSIKWKDENNTWRVATGFTDKKKSQELGEQLELAAKTTKLGLTNPITGAPKLDELLADFEKYLGVTTHAAKTIAYCKKFGFKSVAEIVGGNATTKVTNYLAGKTNLASTTRNNYRTAIQNFCNYLHKQRQLPESPICNLKDEKVLETTLERRALTDKEIDTLFANLPKKKLRAGKKMLTTEQRFWIYSLALHTGFRAKEIASLTPERFVFGKMPIVKLEAKAAKNKKPAEQPLLDKAFALELKIWIDDQPAGQNLFPNKWYGKAADMIRIDLPVKDYIDFHCLRSTYITKLILAGYFPKATQTLARHANIQTTMKSYAKLTPNDLWSEIEVRKGLPTLQIVRTTGAPKTMSKTA